MNWTDDMEKKLPSKQVDPVLPQTNVCKYLVEFYSEDGAELGFVKLIVPSDTRNVGALAFQRAPIKCLAATSIKVYAT